MTVLTRVLRVAFTAAVVGGIQPAAAADELFAAMAKLVSNGVISEPLQGEWKDGGLVDIYLTSSGSTAHIMSPGGDPCVLVHLWITEDPSKSAIVTTKLYDFRKLTGARFLADGDDRSAASRSDDDPAASELLLEGIGWSLARHVNTDPAKPTYHSTSDDSWSIVLLGEEDRRAVKEAVETVGKECFPTRR